MKFIKPPYVDNIKILDLLNSNNAFAANPYMSVQYDSIKNSISQYLNYSGSGYWVERSSMSNELKNKLIYHFENPRKELSYISDFRDLSPDCCPLCGGFDPSSLDHLLPKSTHPDLTIYSLNLVPACSCNVKKSNILHGGDENKTFFHPYFDACLKERLLMSEITGGDLINPDIKIKGLPLTNVHPDKIQFHIDNIINKTNVIKWTSNKWANALRNLRSVITSIPRYKGVISHLEMIDYLNDSIMLSDEDSNTPNNWRSMLLYGIKNSPETVPFLLERHNKIKRNLINPLSV